MLNTDSTPALCCSMSRCRSCNDRRGRGAVSWRREGWHPRTPPSSPGDTVLRAFLPGTLQCRLSHLCATPVLQHLTGGLAEGSRGVKVLKWLSEGGKGMGAPSPDSPPPQTLGWHSIYFTPSNLKGLQFRFGFWEVFLGKLSWTGPKTSATQTLNLLQVTNPSRVLCYLHTVHPPNCAHTGTVSTASPRAHPRAPWAPGKNLVYRLCPPTHGGGGRVSGVLSHDGESTADSGK